MPPLRHTPAPLTRPRSRRGPPLVIRLLPGRRAAGAEFDLDGTRLNDLTTTDACRKAPAARWSPVSPAERSYDTLIDDVGVETT